MMKIKKKRRMVMSLKIINKSKIYDGKRFINKIIVAYLISILAIGTVLPTVHSDSAGFNSLGSQEQTPSGGNQPPIFGTPTPSNGSTNNPLNFTWSIPISDPEGNIFSWTIQCTNGQTNSGSDAINWTKTLALSSLASSMTYEVWVNVTDPAGSGLYTREWYTFTTKQLPAMKVIITKPLKNTLYINNQERRSLPTNTIIYGPITITANVTSKMSIARVEFYVDGRLKATDTAAPYIYLWNPTVSFNGLSLKYTIKVVAYDSEGDSVSAELDVIKWRFHPVSSIITGVTIGGVIALKLIPHTTVSGLFFNVQQSINMTSFYALRIHYWTTGPTKNGKGVINFKTCTGGMIIGPISLLKIGPSHTIVYGAFTFLGDIHLISGGFEHGFTTQYQNTTLADIFQNLRS
jgi:hypothetical protein